MITDRYAGKPFLRLLDSYILHAMGELGQREREHLSAMEPKLQEVYQMDGTWDTIVAAQMDFPSTLPADIKALWEKNRANFREQGIDADPGEFVIHLVDANFPSINQ